MKNKEAFEENSTLEPNNSIQREKIQLESLIWDYMEDLQSLLVIHVRRQEKGKKMKLQPQASACRPANPVLGTQKSKDRYQANKADLLQKIQVCDQKLEELKSLDS